MNKELLQLLKKYPQVKIYPLTYCEVVCDDWGYWIGEIKKVYYGKLWFYRDKFYLKYNAVIEEIKEYQGYEGEEIEIEKNKITVEEGIIILINN